MGHSQAGLALYKGNGTGWIPFISYTWPTDIEIVDSINASPLNSTPYWIVETKIDHVHFGIQPNFWIRVAAYAASKSGAGVQSWPLGSRDAPDDWGLINALTTQIPENLNIEVVTLLSSIPALIAPAIS